MNDQRDDEKVAKAILAYLDDHPHASDTLEGIAEWWLMRHQVRVTVGTLERALQRLSEQGILEAMGSGQERRYRRKI